MNDYQRNLQEETMYLKETVDFIQRELTARFEILSSKKRSLIASRKDMQKDTSYFTNDFDEMAEINQHMIEVNNQTAAYNYGLKRLHKYEKAIGSPYFGRFDFLEDGFSDREKIYIGLQSLIDPRTQKIFVYDWRAPISSIFYRQEPGRASFTSPTGIITGDVLLKRQYKIRDSKLKYFFDSSIRINDEILQEILGRNSSPKMRNIVETIQKEQDIAIRDTENELLIIQGVAGSGKTSIALHRVAFLLYEGLNRHLNFNNIIIISPNTVFSSYISNVLPELGEENVEQTTFKDILDTAFEGKYITENREAQLEKVINQQNSKNGKVRIKNIEFKGSVTFVKILDRLLWHYAHRIIPFEDIYFNGKLIETRQYLKSRFFSNQTGIPMAKQLQRLENIILEKIHPIRKQRLKRLEEIVQQSEGHELEIKQFARLLSIKEAKIFMEKLHRFTKIDYYKVYELLFNSPGLFFKLAEGLELPKEIEDIISSTKENLLLGEIPYEDCAPLLYLKLKIEGGNYFPDIRQVLIDEAQDYYPIQYEIFNLVFRGARYTVLGDVNQSVEKESRLTLYDSVTNILNKEKTVKLFLKKGYRSSYEISRFTQQLLNERQDSIPFERHETKPQVIYMEKPEHTDRAVVVNIKDYISQGLETIAVICKTQQEAEKVYSKLKISINISLTGPTDGKIEKGVSVIPSYLAKGLEFDAVIIYDAGKVNYSTEFDRRLLYISCTRALHRLTIFYTGEGSSFIRQ